ncbi:MAG: RNA methyltransferase [Oscillospiraceae bacterium]|jgi:TrmH family RNA methyltransferase|nr:RNA methyltransferase [Oscillospiraceae bacterium]MDD3262026.1 RNA methyltransferase [Oscillospiraceae bacterium]
MEHITSRRNETVRAAAGLRSASARHEQQSFLCEGARLCADAASSGLLIKSLFYTEKAAQKYPQYLAAVKACLQGEAYLVEPSVAALLADTKSSQEIFCTCAFPADACVSQAAFLQWPAAGACLALEQLQDPANLGTVLRTAEALGVGCVLLCGPCCDPFSPKALRGGMGAAFRLPLVRVPSFVQAAPAFAKAGWQTMAAVPDHTAEPITRANFSRPTIMAVGNEGNGLLPETASSCAHRVTIPMLGRAESLNASASAAILMWEMMRSRGQSNG